MQLKKTGKNFNYFLFYELYKLNCTKRSNLILSKSCLSKTHNYNLYEI